MRILPWQDDRQMLAEVSPWDDWQFAADSVAPVAASFIVAGRGSGKDHRRGRFPRNTPSPDTMIQDHVGAYSSSPSAISTARYHRVFDWALELGTALLTTGRTKLRKDPPPAVPPPRVLVATVEWFRCRHGRVPEDKDLGGKGLPPASVVDEVFGGMEGLMLAADALAGTLT